jgi:hypothetical protein
VAICIGVSTCCHARVPVDAGPRSVADRAGGPARPAGRRRLDLFWIRALCRMCPPLNIRAAAEACMASNGGAPRQPSFFTQGKGVTAIGAARQAGYRPLPPRRRRPGGVLARHPGAVEADWPSTRAAGTPCPPPGRGCAGPAYADAGRAPGAELRALPRLPRATATQLLAPCPNLALCWRAPLALANCVPARVGVGR